MSIKSIIKLAIKTKKRMLIALFLLILMIFLGYRAFQNKNNSEEESGSEKIAQVSLKRGEDFKAGGLSVTAVGTVESMNQVELKSQISAEVKKINFEIGDEVKKGDLLVELDHSSLDAQLQQAAAGVERTKSSLNQVLAGASDEQIESAKKAVEQAKASLEQIKISNENNIKSMEVALLLAETNLGTSNNYYNNTKISVDSALSQINSSLTLMGDILGEAPGNPSANDAYQSILGAKNSQAKNNALSSFEKAKNNYEITANENIAVASKEQITKKDIGNLKSLTQEALNSTLEALNYTKETLNNTITSSTFSESDLNTLKSQVDIQINGVNASKSSLSSTEKSDDINQINYNRALENLEIAKKQAQANLEAAQSSLNIQEAAYNTLVADPRDVDLSIIKASILEAQAAYNLIASNRAKAFIRSPFDATVSSVPVNPHDLVSAGASVISLVNMEGLQIKSYLSDADREKIETGLKVKIKDDEEGIVSRISPSVDPVTKKIETLIMITSEEPKLTVGEVVEAEIFTSEEQNSGSKYLLPLGAITVSQNETFVFIYDNGKAKKNIITIGEIEGTKIEVISGISDNDQIIIEGNKDIEEGELIEIK